MANELQVQYTSGAGPHLYAVIRRLSDLMPWNGTAFEAWNDTHLALYGPDLTDMGGDLWAADAPATLSAGDYRVTFYERAGGTRATTDLPLKTRTLHLPGGGAVVPSGSWRYSDRAHVAQLIDAANIVATWDMNDDGTEDAGLLESDGVAADTYIDRTLLAAGLGAPIDVSIAGATTVQSLADIGAHMTVWYGWHHRGIEEMSQRTGRSADAIAGLMSGYKTYADEELAKLVTILSSDETEEEVIPAMQAIVPVREQECVNPWGWTL